MSLNNKKFTIYGMNGAACTQRILMAALENNAEYELKLVDIRKGDHKQPEHLARQPFGVIPVLEEGNFSMYESRAITRYVNETRGNKLVPSDAQKRALMEQWISLEQGTISPELGGIVKHRVFLPLFNIQGDAEESKKHAEKLKQPLDIMDAHLAKNQYLAGDEFTLADVFYMPYFELAYMAPEKTTFTSRPHLDAWWKRISSRPSWKKIVSISEFREALDKLDVQLQSAQ